MALPPCPKNVRTQALMQFGPYTTAVQASSSDFDGTELGGSSAENNISTNKLEQKAEYTF